MSTMRCGAFTLLLLSLGACASGGRATPPGPTGGQPPRGAAPVSRAQQGDTVYVVEHYVRPERRQQFEDFVNTILWPAFQKTAAQKPARGRVVRQTRMLRPMSANDDGTFTYTFLLDPVVAGESYNVYDVLREVYSEEEARQEYGRFTETWARDFTSRTFVVASSTS
jgi:hypothetical protein